MYNVGPQMIAKSVTSISMIYDSNINWGVYTKYISLPPRYIRANTWDRNHKNSLINSPAFKNQLITGGPTSIGNGSRLRLATQNQARDGIENARLTFGFMHGM